jgi:positive regulator of sigma E activity
MTAHGVVVGADPEAGVEVRLEEPRCQGCQGVCFWRQPRQPALFRLHCEGRFRVGQPVRVALPASYVLFGSLLVHGLPWSALLLGGSFGWSVSGSDLGCLLGASSGMLAALGLLPRFQRRLERAALANLELLPDG